jgi:hypothetical protein
MQYNALEYFYVDNSEIFAIKGKITLPKYF